MDGIRGVACSATRVFTQWKPGSRVRFRAGCERREVWQKSVNTLAGPRLVHRGERTVFLLYLWLAQPPGPGIMRSLTLVRKSNDLCWKEQATAPMFQAKPKWRQNIPRCVGGLGPGVRREGDERATMPVLQNGHLRLGNRVILQAQPPELPIVW
ncbi:hypothetical protein B0H17DRAFT_1140703 [Mycena rosella]|uniref:Uncharacterized protein n=1 Tax=Mycena rosella TaxID=1033263 RepID=A0AAD7GB01_MYCRO|nr:hypothetical protein B0H17DRAFT_1140703 [Mycena rosella]